MHSLINKLRTTMSSDDPHALALVEIANFCEQLSEKVESLSDRVRELERKR